MKRKSLLGRDPLHLKKKKNKKDLFIFHVETSLQKDKKKQIPSFFLDKNFLVRKEKEKN